VAGDLTQRQKQLLLTARARLRTQASPEEEQALAIADAAGPAPAPAQPQPQRQFIGQSIPQAITAPIELLATTLTSGTTGMLGLGAGTVAGLLESIRNGTYGTSVGGNLMAQRAMEGLQRYTYQPRTELAQQALQTVGEVAEAAKLAPVPVTAVPQALAQPAIQQAARGVAPVARQAAEVAAKVPEVAARVPETIESVFRPGQQRRRAELTQIIQQDPYNTDAVRFRLVGDTLRPDTEADKALKQGWREGVVSVVKAASDRDRAAMDRMLSVYKRGKKNERYRALNRPGDVVGESLVTRLDYIDNQRVDAYRELENIVKTQLTGQPVAYEPVVNRFLSSLEDIGVKVKVDENGARVVDLTDSVINGDVKAEGILNRVLARMSNVTGPPDAKAMHELKRYLDTQISYNSRAQMNPLTATAEGKIKDLRRDINDTLGAQFKDYGVVNTRYSEARRAIDNLQKAAGTTIDYADDVNLDKALGSALRKVTSNYSTRVNLINALDETDQVAKKYGLAADDDLINQVIFANEIDRMFGAAADTGLKGQMAQAAETGIEFARKSNAERAFSLLAAGVKKLQGVNEENALRRMEALLQRRVGGATSGARAWRPEQQQPTAPMAPMPSGAMELPPPTGARLPAPGLPGPSGTDLVPFE
jgi:hypothetical protein